MRDMETRDCDDLPYARRRRLLDAHGEVLCSRLYRLWEKGYRPNLELWTYTFDLVHPQKRAVQVQLYTDGTLVDRFPTNIEDGHRVIIAPEDEDRFARFLAQVPAPNALQKFAAIRVGEAAFMVAVWVGFIGFSILFWKVAQAIWHWLHSTN